VRFRDRFQLIHYLFQGLKVFILKQLPKTRVPTTNGEGKVNEEDKKDAYDIPVEHLFTNLNISMLEISPNLKESKDLIESQAYYSIVEVVFYWLIAITVGYLCSAIRHTLFPSSSFSPWPVVLIFALGLLLIHLPIYMSHSNGGTDEVETKFAMGFGLIVFVGLSFVALFFEYDIFYFYSPASSEKITATLNAAAAAAANSAAAAGKSINSKLPVHQLVRKERLLEHLYSHAYSMLIQFSYFHQNANQVLTPNKQLIVALITVGIIFLLAYVAFALVTPLMRYTATLHRMVSGKKHELIQPTYWRLVLILDLIYPIVPLVLFSPQIVRYFLVQNILSAQAATPTCQPASSDGNTCEADSALASQPFEGWNSLIIYQIMSVVFFLFLQAVILMKYLQSYMNISIETSSLCIVVPDIDIRKKLLTVIHVSNCPLFSHVLTPCNRLM
jgi:hypothetical protein